MASIARAAAVSSILATAFGTTACADLAPDACVKPSINSMQLNPNADNVLSMMVSANVFDAREVHVEFGVNSGLESSTPSVGLTGIPVTVPVLGLLPQTAYSARLVAVNDCGKTSSDVMSIQTGALPSDLPQYTAAGSAPSEGFVVFSAGSYGLAIDNTGRVVWYHRYPNGPGLNFQPQPNGRYAAKPASSPGLQEIDPLGNTMRTLTCFGGTARMHDVIALENRGYWLICDEVRTVDLSAQGKSATSRVTGALIQYIDEYGEPAFGWSAFDHLEIDLSLLDPVDLNAPTINWTHANSIDLDKDGNPVVSFRNLNEVVKFNRVTGAVMWRFGGKHSDFTLTNVEGQPFNHQHGVRISADGTLVLLDNLGETSSRAERYELDPVNHTARLKVAYLSSDKVIAQIGGSTQTLANGNTLVAFGNGGGVEEYDASGKTVWRITGNPGYVFRAERIKSLYNPGKGDSR
jgi:hypothetical protein